MGLVGVVVIRIKYYRKDLAGPPYITVNRKEIVTEDKHVDIVNEMRNLKLTVVPVVIGV